MNKIVFISPWFYPRYGGGETHLYGLANFLTKHNKRIVSLSINFKHKKAKGLDYEIYRYGGADSLQDRTKAYEEILAFLKKNKEQLSLVYLFFITSPDLPIHKQFEIIEFLKSEGIPVMLRITSSGRVSSFFENSFNTPYLKLFKSISCFVCLNSEIKKELLALGISNKNIFSVNNGVNVDLFKNLKDKSLHRKVTFLYYGRLSRKKNLKLLLEAWSSFCNLNLKEIDNFRLLVVGDNNFGTENLNKVKKIKSNIKKLNLKNVIYRKAVKHERIMDLIDSSDVYINLSEQEGMSNSLLECMSSGLVCLASKNELNKKILKDKRVLLELNPKKIAEKLDFFYKNIDRADIQKIRKHNRKLILKNYKDEDIYGKYKNKMEKLIK